MPRKIVPLVTGEIYHVYNRGVDKREIFKCKEDYLRFYQSLYLFNSIDPTLSMRHARFTYDDNHKKLVRIHAYALLPNHFHLILEQTQDGGISEFMKRISGGYTSYFNETYDRSGALFQGTYKKVHITDDSQYNYLFAYVNENHYVHAVPQSEDICYSSSNHYQGIGRSKAITEELKKYEVGKARAIAVAIFKKRAILKESLDA